MASSEPTSGVSARTGKDGKAQIGGNQMYRLTQWSITATTSETAWGDSDTEGYTARKAARHDATGSLTGKYDGTTSKKPYALAGGNANHLQGLVAELVLWEAKGASDYWVFPCALIQNYSMTVDQDTKEVIEVSMDWGADGKFWRPGQTGTGAPATKIYPNE